MSVKHETMGIVFALGMKYDETTFLYYPIRLSPIAFTNFFTDHLCSDVMPWEREQSHICKYFSLYYKDEII